LPRFSDKFSEKTTETKFLTSFENFPYFLYKKKKVCYNEKNRDPLIF